MKILFINSFYYPIISGGAEITLKTLAEGMSARGHDVTVLVTNEKNSGVSVNYINNVKVVRVGVKNIYWGYDKNKSIISKIFWHLIDSYNLLAALAIKSYIIKNKPDIVSCHNLSGWSISIWKVIADLHIPIVQVLHDMYLLCPKSTMYRNDLTCNKRCLDCKILRIPHKNYSKLISLVIGVSDYVLDKHIKHGLFENSNFFDVINNSRNIDNKFFLKEKNNSILNIGFIGTINKAKGIEWFLSMAQLTISLKNITFYIAGDGNSEYINFLKQKYESEKIIFLGYVESKEFFEKIDLLIVPSLWEEPLGMVVVEAKCYGVPSIVSNNGGLKELVTHNIDGYICSTDSNQMLYYVDKLYNDRKILRTMSAEAYANSKKYTNINEWCGKYERHYLDLIAHV